MSPRGGFLVFLREICVLQRYAHFYEMDLQSAVFARIRLTSSMLVFFKSLVWWSRGVFVCGRL